MTTASIRAALEATAAKHGLEPNLVEAIVLTESGGNPYAVKPEPFYPYLFNVRTNKPFAVTREQAAAKTAPVEFPALAGHRDQEWWGQQQSWGLMQVMGAVARELGFRGPYLTQLTEVMTGLHYGCKHFAAQLAWAKNRTDLALGAYNAGRGGASGDQGQAYALKVRANLAQVESTTRRA